jgi:hypothetical protein
MINKLGIREIRKFSRIESIPENFKDLDLIKQKQFLLNHLKGQNWSKTDRLDYNTIIFYENFFTCFLIQRNKKCIIIIDTIQINIRMQDYFFIKFMKKITKKKLNKNLWFDQYNFINNKAILVENPESTHRRSKGYRVDYKFHISGENYFCLEFFEKAHKKVDDPDHKIESNRIYSIINNSDDRYKKTLFFAIYWEADLDNDKYFTKFIDTIYDCIDKYKDIDNEDVWCINAIDKKINNKFLSNAIYYSWKEQDIANISIDELNNTINYKNIKTKKKHHNEFIDKIDRLIESKTSDIDDQLLHDIEDSDDEEIITQQIECKENYYKDNMLTFAGLYWYLAIKEEYLIDINEYAKLINFPINITNGFITGLIEQRDSLLDLDKNKIIGLYREL